MSATYNWCQDKTRLAIWDKPVFFDTRLGDKSWFLNGKRHRVDGPAVKFANGDRFWYLNGRCHRENGPAIEYANGDRVWYLNGKQYSESDYWKEVKK